MWRGRLSVLFSIAWLGELDHSRALGGFTTTDVPCVFVGCFLQGECVSLGGLRLVGARKTVNDRALVDLISLPQRETVTDCTVMLLVFVFQAGVHIADVSHFIRPGTALDEESRNRGTSVYLIDRVS